MESKLNKLPIMRNLHAYLNKDNYGYKNLNVVQVNYLRTHLPDKGDVDLTIALYDYASAENYTVQGRNYVVNTLLETVHVLRQNVNLVGLTDYQLNVYAWHVITDMSMYGFIQLKDISYAEPFPFTGLARFA